MNGRHPAAILVVEDDPLLLLFASDLVDEAGFDAYKVVSAEAATVVLDVRDDIVVLFSDISLGGPIDGMDLAWMVHLSRPNIQIVLTSCRPLPEGRPLPPGAEFFPKPYPPDAIVAKFRSLMTADAA